MIFGKRVITWSRIGELDGGNLFICDIILNSCAFGKTSEYKNSLVRDMCRNLYIGCFSDEERRCMIPHPKLRDHVFLLSDVEYIKYSDTIKQVRSRWWLRSPDAMYANFAGFVDNPDGIYYARVTRDTFGFRPAILLKENN